MILCLGKAILFVNFMFIIRWIKNIAFKKQTLGHEVRPDPKVFAKVVEVFKDYENLSLESKTAPYNFQFKIDETNSLVVSNWFGLHKGEVKIRVEVSVHAKEFRVEAWGKQGFFWPRTVKSISAKNIEKLFALKIQEKIGPV